MADSRRAPTSPFIAECRRLREQLRAALEHDVLSAPHAELVYEVIEGIGAGGMGQVFRVRDRRLDRDAALKMLSSAALADPRAFERFLREARITARLSHPSIPPVYEAGKTADGLPYMLMKLIEGETLEERVRRHHRKRPGRRGAELKQLLEIIIKIADALAYAHDQGVVHRDLKPSNIMVGRFGEVMVMDWGVAKDKSESESTVGNLLSSDQGPSTAMLTEAGLTAVGAVVGTPGYMAPEQTEGGAVDARADVFALGIILTEAITGAQAVAGDSSLARLVATAEGRVRTPRRIRRGVPRELDGIAARALAIDPARRTASAGEVAEALRAYLLGEPIPGHRYGLGERLGRAARRRAGAIVGLAGLAIVTAIVGLLWLRLALVDSQRRQAALEAAAREAELTRAADEARASQAGLDKLEAARSLARQGASRELVRARLEESLALLGRSAKSLTAAGRAAVAARDLERARAWFEEAARDFPPAYEALFSLHEMAIGAGGNLRLTPELNRLIERARERGDENAFTLFAAAMDADKARRPDEALALLERIERDYKPRWAWIAVQRGLIRLERGQAERSLADFSRALDLDPELTWARFNRAAALRRLERWKDALDDLDRCLDDAPGFAAAYSARGYIKERLGRWREALRDLDRAIALDAGLLDAHLNRGVAFEKLEQWSEAEAAFARAASLDPKKAQAHAGQGFALMNRRRYAAALACFDRAIALEPENAAHYLNRGLTRRRKGDLKGAIADYSQGLAFEPDNPGLLINRAVACDKGGLHQQALADLDRALKLQPEDPMALANRASLFLKTGAYQRCLQDCLVLERLDPRRANLYEIRGVAYRRLRRYPEALRAYGRAIALDDQDPVTYRNRGYVYKLLGRFEPALADYNKSLVLDPRFAGAYNNRAVVYEKLGRLEEAIADWQEFLRLDPREARSLGIPKKIQELRAASAARKRGR